jgi:hypothetical protein
LVKCKTIDRYLLTVNGTGKNHQGKSRDILDLTGIVDRARQPMVEINAAHRRNPIYLTSSQEKQLRLLMGMQRTHNIQR